jgi:hypothetical protein
MMVESRNSGTRRAAIARQRHGKHVSATTNKRTTLEELLEAVFSILALSRLHNKDPAAA